MAYSRISARRGSPVNLNITFRNGGVPTDPYAIRRIDIYKTTVAQHNLVAQAVIPNPWEDNYPSPISVGTESGDGTFVLCWDIPSDFDAPNVYFDVWSYIPVDPCLISDFSAGCIEDTYGTHYSDLDAPELSGLVLRACNRFWVYPEGWDASDGLSSIRLGFEPLDQKFRQPEVRPLEVGIMPLPLYDYDFNLNTPVLAAMTATISIETMNRELLVDEAPMELGVRQGSYRSNPFVFRYIVDTLRFLRGTYKYRITATLPDGSTRSSKDFILVIA